MRHFRNHLQTLVKSRLMLLISCHDAVGGRDASIRVDGVTLSQLQDNDFIHF